jgi:hypothetical protein
VSDETPEERAAAWLALPWPNEDGIASTLARDVLALSAEVDRLRHGEKVRDGMLRHLISGGDYDPDIGGEPWWIHPLAPERPLTPDEVAVLAALTEEDGAP